jgi:hypothetical protein
LHLDRAVWRHLSYGGWIERTILEGEFEGSIGLGEIGGFDHQRFAVDLDGEFDGMCCALLLPDLLGMNLFGTLEQRQPGGTILPCPKGA